MKRQNSSTGSGVQTSSASNGHPRGGRGRCWILNQILSISLLPTPAGLRVHTQTAGRRDHCAGSARAGMFSLAPSETKQGAPLHLIGGGRMRQTPGRAPEGSQRSLPFTLLMSPDPTATWNGVMLSSDPPKTDPGTRIQMKVLDLWSDCGSPSRSLGKVEINGVIKQTGAVSQQSLIRGVECGA